VVHARIPTVVAASWNVGRQCMSVTFEFSVAASNCSDVRRATPARLRGQAFSGGSMGPKVEAVCRVVEGSGGRAAIGQLEAIPELHAGRWPVAGLRVPRLSGIAKAGVRCVDSILHHREGHT
jgi:hypothetical protein